MHDDLSVVRSALRNWGAWVRVDALPDQRASLSAIWSLWRPAAGWDAGWGEPAPPERTQGEVDERSAEALDRALLRVPKEHFRVLKGHFAEDRFYVREVVDAACRSLLDVLGRVD